MAINNDILDQLIGTAKTEEDVFGKDGILKELSSKLVNRILEKELEHHLKEEPESSSDEKSKNYRNGYIKKKLKTSNGTIDIQTPRDRDSEFDPTFVRKRQRKLLGLDEKVLALYGRGMSTRDIQSFVQDLYGMEVSKELISDITDSINEEVKQWRLRPLDEVYPIVYIDGFVVKCKDNGTIKNRCVYIVFGVNMSGTKEVLGLYLDGNEGAKYWLHVLNEIKNRGVQDILIICADGLKGLDDAISAAFPKTIMQTCIVHLIRCSLNFVPWQDKKAVVKDLKSIYQAKTVSEAENALDDFELTWGDKYPAAVKTWRQNWEKVIPFLDFPADIRKVIYTTNSVESLNRQLRKSTKTKGHFPSEDAVYKTLYLSITQAQKKWTMPIRDWTRALNQLCIMFEGRIPEKYTGGA